MEKDIENRPMDKVGEEEGEGERYGESNIEIHNTMCKTGSQWEFAIWLRELKQGLCNSLKGGVEGRWEGEDMGVPMSDSCWYMTENHKIL